MEQHPVPQNITGFQFKLIGDMTVKQFAYLAGGVLSAYIVLQLGVPALIKWALALFLGTSGFAFAFVPIEERPLDRWLASFLKNVYAPTQFLWKKSVVPPEILTSALPITFSVDEPQILKKEEVATKIEEYLLTLPNKQAASGWVGDLDQKEAGFLSQILASFRATQPQPKTVISTPVPLPIITTPLAWPQEKPEAPIVHQTPTLKPVVAAPTVAPPVKQEEFAKKTENLTDKITILQQELSTQTVTKERFLQIQSQLSQLLTEKDRLTNELVELKRTLAERKQEPTVRPVTETQVDEEERVKIVTPQVGPKIGIPKSSSLPNAPSGIVKNRKGAILSGIMVEIKDQEGTPVRALKTNKVGQFTVATPLPNGTYTVHLSDPQKTFYFDIIEITVKGEIVAPLEIFAKTQQDKSAEELRKKLFGTDNF